MFKNKIISSTLLLIIGLAFSACNPTETPQSTVETQVIEQRIQDESSENRTGEDSTNATVENTTYEFTANEDNQTALTLLESSAGVKTQDFGTAGKFVTAINGLESNNDYFWGFYVNGEFAQQGVTQTILSKGDVIKFIYEKAVPSN